MTGATLPTQLPIQWLAANGTKLAYRHHPGDPNSSLPGILYLGGFQSSMEGEKAVYLIEEAMKRGQQVTCFDYRGHGATGGDMKGLGVESWCDDAAAILDQVCQGPQIFVGSSMGGWVMTLLWLIRAARAVKLVGIASGPDFTEDLIRPQLTVEHQKMLADQGFIMVDSRYDPDGYEITRDLLDQGARNRVLDRPHRIDIPVILMHGDADPDVPLMQSQKLYACFDGEDIALQILKGGDHRLSDAKWLRHLGRAVFC